MSLGVDEKATSKVGWTSLCMPSKLIFADYFWTPTTLTAEAIAGEKSLKTSEEKMALEQIIIIIIIIKCFFIDPKQ